VTYKQELGVGMTTRQWKWQCFSQHRW